MPKYKVTLKEVVARYKYDVEAKDEQEACEKATELLLKGVKAADEDRKLTMDAEAIRICEINVSDFWAGGLDSRSIYHIMEGTGDNLSREDVENGFVDYIYYEEYDLRGNCIDGGMWLLEKPFGELTVEEILGTFEEELSIMPEAPEWAKEE